MVDMVVTRLEMRDDAGAAVPDARQVAAPQAA